MRQDDDKKEEVDLGLLQVIAQENNVSDCCLRQAGIVGRLKHYKINKRVYCKRSEVKEYLKSRHSPLIKKSSTNELLYPAGYISPSHYRKFNVKPNVIYYAVYRNKIPFQMIDGHYVLKESDVTQYLSHRAAKRLKKCSLDGEIALASQKSLRRLRKECSRSSL